MVNVSIVILLIIIVILFLTLVFVALPFFFGAPYGGTRKKQLEIMLKLADLKKSDRAVDLGSGDGRIVLEIAKKDKGIKVEGYEINPFLYVYSKLRLSGLKNAKINYGNFSKVNLDRFNKIFVFQYSYVMSGLEKKLLRELKKGSLIISNKWTFPNLKPVKIVDGIYLYKIK